MRYLFVHQNFPGQYQNLAAQLARDEANQVVAISKRQQDLIKGVRHLKYELSAGARETTMEDLRRLEEHLHYGRGAAAKAIELKREGFKPDIICVHPGWGEALYLKDVWPDVPQLHYCEYYFHARKGVNAARANQPLSLRSAFRTRIRNVLGLLSLETADWGITPTNWQFRQFPVEFKSKLSILHEGINLGNCKPNPAAEFEVPDGRKLSRRDEVVTYVSRNLEPARGFPEFIRVAEILCRERPNCEFVIGGGDEVSYSPALPDGETYREKLLAESELDLSRVHFMGKVPYLKYLTLLQISSAHVYLTTPFVLSWSCLEAMAIGCLLVASATAPVEEVIVDGENGLLVEFSDVREIADKVNEVLDDPEKYQHLRQAARRSIGERYRLKDCLANQIALLHDVAAGKPPPPGIYPPPA